VNSFAASSSTISLRAARAIDAHLSVPRAPSFRASSSKSRVCDTTAPVQRLRVLAFDDPARQKRLKETLLLHRQRAGVVVRRRGRRGLGIFLHGRRRGRREWFCFPLRRRRRGHDAGRARRCGEKCREVASAGGFQKLNFGEGEGELELDSIRIRADERRANDEE